SGEGRQCSGSSSARTIRARGDRVKGQFRATDGGCSSVIWVIDALCRALTRPERSHGYSSAKLDDVSTSEWTPHFFAVACSDVICSDSLFTARPFRAIVDSSQDLPRTGRSLHSRSRKAGSVPHPQSILLTEPNDDRRMGYAEYLHTLGFTVLTADTTDDGLSRASDANVIVIGMWAPGS